MSPTSESIAKNVREEVETLLGMVMNDGQERPTSADQVERHLWRGVLMLGRMLMQLFFTVCSEREARHKAIEVEGGRCAHMGQPSRPYVSLFGEVEVKRHYYWSPGAGGRYPLDAELSLPKRIYSDCVQEMMGGIEVWVPQDHTLGLIEQFFGLTIPKGSLQGSTADQARYVDAYYDQRAALATPDEDTLLVVTVDGKGIPMTRRDSPPPQARRSKGQKKTAKKEAIVTATYTVAPYPRTSDDIIQALLASAREIEVGSNPPARPSIHGKQTFGTLEGKTVALDHLSTVVAQRQQTSIVHRIALTDGALALQQRTLAAFPDFTLILDIIHAVEYLWDAANTLLGETHPDRSAWMTDALRCMLDDDLERLLCHLDYQRTSPTLSSAQQKTLTTVVNYLRRNQPYMQYQYYLAQGWPIGTGVIEGACRHLVKDRFEQSGMHWSRAGAETMLHLRAVSLNGDWVDFQRFRRQQAHLTRYRSPYPEPLPGCSPEPLFLEAAA
jgi:hypothetical protein